MTLYVVIYTHCEFNGTKESLFSHFYNILTKDSGESEEDILLIIEVLLLYYSYIIYDMLFLY